jgi:hypothetical protein
MNSQLLDFVVEQCEKLQVLDPIVHFYLDNDEQIKLRNMLINAAKKNPLIAVFLKSCQKLNEDEIRSEMRKMFNYSKMPIYLQ